MAEFKKKRNPEFTSPRLVLKYPKLTKVDYGTEKFPKPKGEYNTQGIVKKGSPEHQWFIDKIGPLHEQSIKDGEAAFAQLSPPQRKKLKELTINDYLTEEFDRETEKPTGNLLAKFKMAASGISKKDKTPWTRKPALFDAKGRPLGKSVQIWGGSEGKINFEVVPYFVEGQGQAGISFFLNAAQIIDLKSGGVRAASGYGFGEEEGYEGGGADDDDNPGVGDDVVLGVADDIGVNSADDGNF